MNITDVTGFNRARRTLNEKRKLNIEQKPTKTEPEVKPKSKPKIK